ncbi:hypothetical protein [Herpetosiphon giganteus]|uniref:hypothetical protein n=1 Tax=Herpetosiphon giganteus TaxID=2029754 RepID=UPI00195611AA|nr:hypothetical protein [Herpetosiphon giganteus]
MYEAYRPPCITRKRRRSRINPSPRLVKVSELEPCAFFDTTLLDMWSHVLNGIYITALYDKKYFEEIKHEQLKLSAGKRYFVRMAYQIETLIHTSMEFYEFLDWRSLMQPDMTDEDELYDSYSLELRFSVAKKWFSETPLAVYGLPISFYEIATDYHLATWILRYPFMKTALATHEGDFELALQDGFDVIAGLKQIPVLPSRLARYMQEFLFILSQSPIHGFNLGLLIPFALRITGNEFADYAMAEVDEDGGFTMYIDWLNPEAVGLIIERQKFGCDLADQFEAFSEFLNGNESATIDIFVHIYGAAAVVLANHPSTEPTTLMELFYETEAATLPA